MICTCFCKKAMTHERVIKIKKAMTYLSAILLLTISIVKMATIGTNPRIYIMSFYYLLIAIIIALFEFGFKKS